MTDSAQTDGTAALAICESLLLALGDLKVMSQKDILGVLQDAAAAFENAPPGQLDVRNAAVAGVINGMLVGGTPVRRR